VKNLSNCLTFTQ